MRHTDTSTQAIAASGRRADTKASGLIYPFVGLACALLLTALIYAPGLSGDFIFDDYAAIVENTSVHVDSLHLSQWAEAAFSFGSKHQGRMLSQLSFAANHFLTGLDPFWMKLTNLFIHLGNGLLLFMVLRALLDLWRAATPYGEVLNNVRAAWATLAISAVWLVLPVNLTAVLYIVQRMESLSNSFVLLGLWIYLRARIDHWHGQGGLARMALGFVLCAGTGAFVKETAVLLPLYAACIELAITGFRNADGRRSRALVVLYSVFLVLPAIAAGAWLLSWVDSPTTYERTFTIGERLITEARVLVMYIGWTLAPLPDALGLYHDDIVVSRGLLDPPTTLIAIAVLAGLLGSAVWQMRRRPLFALGVFWFFAAHTITGTVIPLEFAFEHRNYFSSIGLLLAAASLLNLERGLRFPSLRIIITLAAIACFTGLTALMSREWSEPNRLAVMLAEKHPRALRAQNALANRLLSAAGPPYHRDSPLVQRAQRILESSIALAQSSIFPEHRLIHIAAVLKEPVQDRWWDSIAQKLSRYPASHSDLDALERLLRCQTEKICPRQTGKLLSVFIAAVSRSGESPALLATYARFAASELGDLSLAERLVRKAISLDPKTPRWRMNLVSYLIHAKRWDVAQEQLEALQRFNRLGSLDRSIAVLEQQLDHARNSKSGDQF